MDAMDIQLHMQATLELEARHKDFLTSVCSSQSIQHALLQVTQPCCLALYIPQKAYQIPLPCDGSLLQRVFKPAGICMFGWLRCSSC
jgi:hypothetical protein